MKRLRRKFRSSYIQPKIDVRKKTGSIAFFIAIPCTVVLGMVSFLTLFTMIRSIGIDAKSWILFSCGFIGTMILFATVSFASLRTFIHEAKHAVLVILTGNRLTEFRVSQDVGHVGFMIYSNKVHFGPFIALAPYFLPLFSFPVLFVISCLGVSDWAVWDHEALSCILGMALSLDLTCAYLELSPAQSDLRRIFGGVVSAYMFIFAINTLWISLCLIWIQGGVDGYIIFGYHLLEIAERVTGIHINL